VVGSLEPPAGVEDLAEFSLGVGGLASGGDHPGDLVPGGQDVGVVGSHDPRRQSAQNCAPPMMTTQHLKAVDK